MSVSKPVQPEPGLERYIRPEAFPTPFCPGCGHGILMGAMVRAAHKMGLDFEHCVFVSGIGCAAWIPSPHFAADTLHVTHGRAIAYATGVKLFRPELEVVVISGDGDLASIGGNHLIHAARRDVDLSVICANNYTYGMTGGQVAPTTPIGCRTSTTPMGNQERPFDLCRLVAGAQAGFVARGSVTHVPQLVKLIEEAIRHEGFAFLEVLSPCFTGFGRRNAYPSAPRMLEELRIACKRAPKGSNPFTPPPEGKILLGRFDLP